MNMKKFVSVFTNDLRQIGSVCFALSILSLFVVFMSVDTYAEAYEYDELNRVIKVIYDDQSYITYEYDANGNIESQKFYEAEDPDPGNDDAEIPGGGATDSGNETPGGSMTGDGNTSGDNNMPNAGTNSKPSTDGQTEKGHQDGMQAKSANATYIITSTENKTVSFYKLTNKKKTSYTVPNTVKIDGVTYQVTEIAAKAFKNNKKLKKITIGKNITKIGKQAFYGCKKLKTITFKTTKLKSIGKQAFKGIHKKATIKVPRKKYKKYKKLLKGKGQKKTVKIKKR